LLKQQPASWTPTGSLNTVRREHTATLLPNGMVLVAGGLPLTAFSRARNCTTPRPGPGYPRAVSIPAAVSTRRPCCPTGRCWLQGD
jgi:hypothetical protein